MAAGYTGTARRGISIRDYGASDVQLSEVTHPCLTCGKIATLETFEVSGQLEGILRCPTYRRSKFQSLCKGCPPKRLKSEELEKIMAFTKEKKPRLTAEERQEIQTGIQACGLTINKLNDLAGMSRARLDNALKNKCALSPDEMTRIRDVIKSKRAEIESAAQKLETNKPDQTPREVPVLVQLDAQAKIGRLEMLVEELTSRVSVLEEKSVAATNRFASSAKSEELDQKFRGFEYLCSKMRRLSPERFDQAVHRARQTVA